MAVCFAADNATTIKNRAVPFKAVVALYPYCNPIDKLNASLLVLIGKAIVGPAFSVHLIFFTPQIRNRFFNLYDRFKKISRSVKIGHQ